MRGRCTDNWEGTCTDKRSWEKGGGGGGGEEEETRWKETRKEEEL